PEKVLPKLSSLARLALSAAAQKRDFLRRHRRDHPAVTRGFLLDRARLVVVPVGLEAAVQRLLGRGLGAGKPALDFARRLLQHLAAELHRDGRRVHLETCVDDPADFRPAAAARGGDPARVAGLTAWDAAAPARQQVRLAGALHAAAGGGTAA